jgi:hypothetical protein
VSGYIFISILAIASVTIIIAVVLILINKRRRGKTSVSGKSQSTVLKPGRWQGHHEGIDYSWQYQRGSRNSPSFLRVAVNCQSPGSFKITKETGIDRFFKKLGICCEIKTHDTAFDDKFYITTNTVNFTGLFFGKSRKRKIVNEIYDKGFKEISHNGKVMTAKFSPFKPGKQFDINLISEVAAVLAELSREMPIAPGPRAFDTSGWKMKRAIAFIVPILLEITGVALLVIGLSKYNPLDEFKLILGTLKFSVPLLIIFLWLAVQLLKGRSSSHRELIIVIFLSLFAFVLAGAGSGIFLNGYLDQSQPVNHETLVVGKHISRSKNSTSYYVRVESWRKDGDKESLRVSRNEYDRVVPQKTELTVTTKPGKFKYEWLVGFKLYL